MSKQKTFIEISNEFELDDWINLVDNLYHNSIHEINLPLGKLDRSERFYLISNLVYSNYDVYKNYISACVVKLQQIPPTNEQAEGIYDLINLFIDNRPLFSKNSLEKIIREEKFENLYWLDESLHELLIFAYTNLNTKSPRLHNYLASYIAKKNNSYSKYLHTIYGYNVGGIEGALKVIDDYLSSMTELCCKEIVNAIIEIINLSKDLELIYFWALDKIDRNYKNDIRKPAIENFTLFLENLQLCFSKEFAIELMDNRKGNNFSTPYSFALWDLINFNKCSNEETFIFTEWDSFQNEFYNSDFKTSLEYIQEIYKRFHFEDVFITTKQLDEERLFLMKEKISQKIK